MSEKPALDPEPAVEKTDQDQDRDRGQSNTTTSDPHKKQPRARLWKTLCYVAADLQLRNLYRFALTHAQEAQRERWQELTGWVSPWVMILFVRVVLSHPENPIRVTKTDPTRD